jgi:excisionase family DNA binding protein
MYDPDDGWLTVDECAARLRITTQQVQQLVEERVLRARRDGALVLVQPAIIRGVTT